MANPFNGPTLTGNVITMELARLLGRRLDELAAGPRRSASEVPRRGACRVGDTVRMRQEPRFDAWASIPPDIFGITETATLVTLSGRVTLDFQFDHLHVGWPIDQFSQRVLLPAADALAHRIFETWPDGATLVTAPLEVPALQGLVWESVVEDPGKLWLRAFCANDMLSGNYLCRADVLYGFLNVPYQLTQREHQMLVILNQAKRVLEHRLANLREAA